MWWKSIVVTVLLSGLPLTAAHAEDALTWGLANGSESWPAWAREAVTNSMNEAVALYNKHGYFKKHVTANYNPGVPTAQADYDGWIDFGKQYSTRTALHELAHALGTGTYWAFDGGAWNQDWAAGKLVKLYDGQGAVLSTGGSHFWPYGLNYDNEDSAAGRERHCKLLAAFRFDMGIVVDSDKDGLRDDWETFFFQGLSQAADGDPDADGISNLDEQASDNEPQRASPVRDGRTYVVRSQISDRVLTLVGDKRSEGTGVALRAADDSPSQQWTAHDAGGGFFRFTRVDDELVLAVPGTDTASARPLQLTRSSTALSQQWRVVTGPGAKDGFFQLSNRETGRVADGLDGADGAAVQQYPLLGNLPQQYWRFEEVGSDTMTESDAGVTDSESSLDAGTPEGRPDVDAGRGVRTDAAVRVDAGRAALTDASTEPADEQDEGDDESASGAGRPRQLEDGCSLGSTGGGRGLFGLGTLLFALALGRRRRLAR